MRFVFPFLTGAFGGLALALGEWLIHDLRLSNQWAVTLIVVIGLFAGPLTYFLVKDNETVDASTLEADDAMQSMTSTWAAKRKLTTKRQYWAWGYLAGFLATFLIWMHLWA